MYSVDFFKKYFLTKNKRKTDWKKKGHGERNVKIDTVGKKIEISEDYRKPVPSKYN